MRLKVKDLLATILVAAIAVAYTDLVVGSDLTLVQDARAMAGVGLVFALAAYLILGRGDALDASGRLGAGLALVSLTLGVVAYELALSPAADTMLALFMGSIVVVWAVKLLAHAGVLRRGNHATSTMVST